MPAHLKTRIHNLFQAVFQEQNDGATPPQLTADSVLLDTGLDSLGFAILVVRLEEELGFDPFVLSAEPYYPTTFGEFVEFYEINQPQ